MGILFVSALILLKNVIFCVAAPVDVPQRLQPRQVDITRTPDGGFQTTFSLAQAFRNPGSEGTIAASRVYNTGPNGLSSAGGQSANIRGNSPGLEFGYSMSNSAARVQNQFGTAEADAHAMANMAKTPWRTLSNTNSDAHANVNRFNNDPYGSPILNGGYF